MKDQCFLLRESQNFGGNAVASIQRIIVRRNAALGDVLCATVVADRLVALGYEVEFQSHPSAHPILRRTPAVGRISESHGYCHVDLDGAYETHIYRRSIHFHDAWFARANQSLNPYGIDLGKPFNARPGIVLSPAERAIARAKFTDYPQPWVFICPRSHTYTVRQVPDGVWQEIAKLTNGTKFWLGLYPAPSGLVDLNARSIENVIVWLSAADLLITVDTGPMHFAAALGKKVLALGQSSSPELHLSDQRDFQTVWPQDKLLCLNCQENVCRFDRYMPPCQRFDPVVVANRANDMLRENRISCVIPTFAADPAQLKRCLEQVSPQVDEVVVSCAADGVVPDIAFNGTRVVKSHRAQLGFGKNVNFGLRHTTGDWVLLLNDDCYLEPGCVEQLRKLCAPDVGMIAHLLRYPNGKIYFAGRQRHPGQRGFPHISHNEYLPSINAITEMEAVSGTSVLINRKAFYEIGGFDERFMMYAEDDDISMRMRQAGYRLLYHPLALGIHEGSATSKKTGDIQRWIGESGKLMENLWGWYWDKNKDRIPGVFK